VSVSGSESITCTTPSGSAGPQDVVVALSDGRSVTQAGGFTYYTATLTSITSLPYGSTSGGETLTLAGTGFMVGTTPTVAGPDEHSRPALSGQEDEHA